MLYFSVLWILKYFIDDVLVGQLTIAMVVIVVMVIMSVVVNRVVTGYGGPDRPQLTLLRKR